MPLPLLLVAGVAAGGSGSGLLIRAKRQISSDKRRYEAEKASFERMQQHYRSTYERTQSRLERLGRKKAEATRTLGNAARLIKRAKVKQRDLFEAVEVTPQDINAWKGASVTIQGTLEGLSSSATSGALTAMGVYGLVSTFGTASTGTAIGTLSGAAAKKATLAWLGGKAVAAGGGGMAVGTVTLGTLAAGPALLTGGFFATHKAAKVAKEVDRCIGEMRKAKKQMEMHLTFLRGVWQRADEIEDAVSQVNQTLKELLATADPQNQEDVFRVAKFAKRLGELLDAPIVDET